MILLGTYRGTKVIVQAIYPRSPRFRDEYLLLKQYFTIEIQNTKTSPFANDF